MHINIILEELKQGKSKRTQISLERLNTLLEKRFKLGEKDYSIATIGKVSSAEGGIGEVSIRNHTGIHFRLLIDAWASKANTSMKKPPIASSRKDIKSNDMDLLKNLKDPVMRAAFGQIIAEKRNLKAENRILKQTSEIVLDMRQNIFDYSDSRNQEVKVISSLNSILIISEIEALKDAINIEHITARGWKISSFGAIRDENDRPLFKTGFISAIQKILDEI